MIATVLLGILAVFTVIGFLFGLLRGWKKATLMLALTLVALVGALVISGSAATAVDPALLMAELEETAPEAVELLEALPSLIPLVLGLARPLVFFALFLGLSILLWLLGGLLSLLLLRYKKGQKRHRLLSGVISGVQGLLVAALLLTPVLGYATVADDAIATLEENTDITNLRAEFITPMREDPILSTVTNVTAPLFNTLSSFRLDETAVTLDKEVPILSSAYGHIETLSSSDVADFAEKEKGALRALSDLFSDSQLLPTITAELLSAATTSWSRGDAFLGLEKPEMEGELAVFLDELLDLFTDSNATTIRGDFDTVAEFLILMIDYDVLAEGGDTLDKLTARNPETDKTFVKAAVELIDRNAHLAPLRRTLMTLGAETVIGQLGTAEEIRETCEPMVEEMVTILRDAEGDTNEEKIQSLTPTIREELAKNEIEIPDDVVDEASRFLLDELEARDIDLSELTEEDIFSILDSLAAGGIN